MGTSLLAIVPECLLTATMLVVLLTDAFLRRSAARGAALGWISALGVLAALVVLLLPSTDQTVFSGMLAVDGFARFFRGLFLICALFGVAFVSVSDEIPEDRIPEYLVLLLCLTLGLSLLAASQHLLMLYLALELVSLPSYVLAGFRRADRQSSEAALKYVIYGGAASGLMLYGFSLLYGLSGTLDLAGVGRFVLDLGAQPAAARVGVAMAALLSLAGFGYKVAFVPFHMWCPDVYQGAPTPFVAFLSVASKAAGVAALLRFLVVGFGLPAGSAAGQLPWDLVLGVLAVATMTLGNLVAIVQDNLKRLLAYSSIAHAGTVLMAVAVATPNAVRAVMFYLGVYVVMNLGAFLAVMAVRAQTGSESISEYRGLASKAPFLAIALAVFLFSLTGLPPLGGFIAKFYVFAALLETRVPFFYAVALAGVLNSAISLYYYARVIRAMFLEKAADEEPATPSRASSALLAALAVPTIVLGVWWAPLSNAIDDLTPLAPKARAVAQDPAPDGRRPAQPPRPSQRLGRAHPTVPGSPGR